MSLLSERGPIGARRDEIVAAVDRSRATVADWLAVKRDFGVITASGAGKAARYYLRAHSPGAADQAHAGELAARVHDRGNAL